MTNSLSKFKLNVQGLVTKEIKSRLKDYSSSIRNQAGVLNNEFFKILTSPEIGFFGTNSGNKTLPSINGKTYNVDFRPLRESYLDYKIKNSTEKNPSLEDNLFILSGETSKIINKKKGGQYLGIPKVNISKENLENLFRNTKDKKGVIKDVIEIKLYSALNKGFNINSRLSDLFSPSDLFTLENLPFAHDHNNRRFIGTYLKWFRDRIKEKITIRN